VSDKNVVPTERREAHPAPRLGGCFGQDVSIAVPEWGLERFKKLSDGAVPEQLTERGEYMATTNRMTKAQIISELAEKTGITKKDVNAVFSHLQEMIKRELGKKGPGEFVIPDMFKLKVRAIPARKERKGMDPFTKQERVFPAKPASKKIRATALKKLKDLIK
jgi:nucleoid DNA-binding protein